MKLNTIIQGDCLEELKKLPKESIDCVITSSPYWGLRDYGVEGQIGLEKTPEEYVAKMVEIFREVKRVLKKEGTCWLNLGDSYGSGSRKSLPPQTIAGHYRNEPGQHNDRGKQGYSKQLIGIPWRVAFALQRDGWILRQDIIWNKPNPMPESVTDRCTKSHEYIFLLTKSLKYYYDNEAIREPVQPCSIARLDRAISNKHKNINGAPGQPPHTFSPPRPNKKYKRYEKSNAPHEFEGADHLVSPFDPEKGRNKRSVWTITTKPYSEAHFATFPEDLIIPMVLAGCPKEGIVLDPFIGAGTTGLVAKKFKRNWLGIELNPEYIKIAEERVRSQTPPLL